ncbi:MAG: galactose ABC transporter substrate-binding protein [Lactimicrobium sp.]|jgi:methyl-galactoside transport system substrate-binding protein|uniref:galactose ABC transporter substrate-binding protein n=1 Tax=Lactimicrobium sp. TaxID=2563780 RepID=UPI002F35DCC8
MKKLAILCALALSLSGCSAAPSKKTYSIGVAVYDGSDTFISSICDTLSSEAEKDGIHVSITDAGRSQLNENDQVNDLIDDGADILCINLVDRSATSTIINAAMDKNIPVIFFNREPVQSDLTRWEKLYYVGADAEESGRLQGQIAANWLATHPEADRNQDGIIQYYILEGEPGHQDTIIRSETAVSTLDEAGISLEKAGYAICDWQRDEAYDKTSQLIKDGTYIELLLCNNDEMAAGAVQAYDDAGISMDMRPAIAGIDGTKEGISLVNSGKIIGTVYNNYKDQAEKIYQLADALMNNKSLQDLNLQDGHSYYSSYQKITPDNVSSFLGQ